MSLYPFCAPCLHASLRVFRRIWSTIGHNRRELLFCIFRHFFLPSHSFSALFLDTELQQRNAECFLTVVMTSGDHSLIPPLKFILAPISSILGSTISREGA